MLGSADLPGSSDRLRRRRGMSPLGAADLGGGANAPPPIALSAAGFCAGGRRSRRRVNQWMPSPPLKRCAVPLVGSRTNGASRGWSSKSNMLESVPAIWSNEA